MTFTDVISFIVGLVCPTPPSGTASIYIKNNKKLAYKDDTGTETEVSTASFDAAGAAAAAQAASIPTSFLDTDTTLAANSDSKVATQKAIKAYIASVVTGMLNLKGSTDCSGNPNYPSAVKGDYYIVTVAGKIGGASGTPTDIGDTYFAVADNAGGTEASVGSSWGHLEHNLIGALLTANALSELSEVAAIARSNIGAAADLTLVSQTLNGTTYTASAVNLNVRISTTTPGGTVSTVILPSPMAVGDRFAVTAGNINGGFGKFVIDPNTGHTLDNQSGAKTYSGVPSRGFTLLLKAISTTDWAIESLVVRDPATGRLVVPDRSGSADRFDVFIGNDGAGNLMYFLGPTGTNVAPIMYVYDGLLFMNTFVPTLATDDGSGEPYLEQGGALSIKSDESGLQIVLQDGTTVKTIAFD